MLSTTEQQILRVIYQWGCEVPKSTVESDLQIMLGQEVSNLRAQGLIHIGPTQLALTPKGAEFAETNRLVSTQQIQDSQKARNIVRKAIRCFLDHDQTGYSVGMQDARKELPARYVTAIERYFWHNLP